MTVRTWREVFYDDLLSFLKAQTDDQLTDVLMLLRKKSGFEPSNEWHSEFTKAMYELRGGDRTGEYLSLCETLRKLWINRSKRSADPMTLTSKKVQWKGYRACQIKYEIDLSTVAELLSISRREIYNQLESEEINRADLGEIRKAGRRTRYATTRVLEFAIRREGELAKKAAVIESAKRK